ncbi:MAG: hypothetical protein HYU66_06920 [Armatimonadetes bacterium]|nr:hypothetical protein [Armatimonadota bacterium]
MTTRERILAVLDYQPYDRLPILHFGFLERTIQRWRDEGHLTAEEARDALQGDGSPGEDALSRKLGFDGNYHRVFGPDMRIRPAFPGKLLEELPDGRRKYLNGWGNVLMWSPLNQSIPAEVDHLLKGRAEWDAEFRWRLEFQPERVTQASVNCGGVYKPFGDGGCEWLMGPRDEAVLLHCGSLYGALRDYMGVVGLSLLIADDEPLLDEMLEVNADLAYRCAEAALESGATFDIAHFWEDICFKNGPLVNPRLFHAKVGPHYKRITDLCAQHGIRLVSLDCDGLIDELIPTWLDHGVNVMFPIEVGTWAASFAPWRQKYGRELRGVGGLDKRVFQHDYAAVDAEIERLKPIVELGGYIPCSDHWLEEAHRVLRAHLGLELPDPARASPSHPAVQAVLLTAELLFRFWGSRDPPRAVGAVAGLEPAFLRGALRAAAMCHAPWPPSLALRVLQQAEQELRPPRRLRAEDGAVRNAACEVLGEAWSRYDPDGLTELHRRLYGPTTEGGWWAAEWLRAAHWGLTARARIAACLALAAEAMRDE